jgi:NAD(P)-dependent dehydrogenase (short-subunit alcohol dehydrogenase family)
LRGGKGEIGEGVKVWKCDMSDYGRSASFVERVGGLERVDGVVLNAGFFELSFEEEGYGWEEDL